MSSVPPSGDHSSDEEPDYMSDNFLKQCVPNDVRPSLLLSRTDKRKHDLLIRQQKRNRTKEDLEKERVKSMEEALKIPIAEDNKGFKMLQKMGYKPGNSIGKDSSSMGNNSNNQSTVKRGIKEPITIDIKTGRGGLGRETHEIEKLKKAQGNVKDFRLMKQSAAKAREIASDLKKAQFACQSLDEEAGILKPIKLWYWPRKEKKKEDDDQTLDIDESERDGNSDGIKRRKLDESSESESEEEDEEDAIPDEFQLETIRDFLRQKYFYCVWCGVKYENSSDLDDSCPGVEKDDH